MDFSGGKLMETGEDLPFPMMSVVKEERSEFDEVSGIELFTKGKLIV